jgi:hypothetical protein
MHQQVLPVLAYANDLVNVVDKQFFEKAPGDVTLVRHIFSEDTFRKLLVFGLSNTCSAPPTTRSTFSKVHLPPISAPTRTRPLFFVFSFTSSPYDCKKLGNSDLRVKVSPLFPSPVKAEKGYFLHTKNTLYQRIVGGGEG